MPLLRISAHLRVTASLPRLKAVAAAEVADPIIVVQAALDTGMMTVAVAFWAVVGTVEAAVVMVAAVVALKIFI